MQNNTPAVSIRELRKNFGSLEVLKGVNLDAAEGDVISILGSSGSGKSTMLRCINFLELPSSGSVRIHGEELLMKRAKQGLIAADMRQINRIRTEVAMVFQSFNLWSHMTILENIIEAPIHLQKRSKAEVKEEAIALLERVGIADKRNNYPSHLSGGQQQRAAIARALAMKPRLLLFDEPTSALDPELVGEVLKVMRSLAEAGHTMLVVTHEMGFARDVSNRVVFLHAGSIDEDGPSHEVFSNPRSERFKKFISLQR